MSKRLLFIISVLLFVSAGAFAQVGGYSSTATDTTGKRLSLPTVKVCADALCSTPVTIYKDAAQTALSNPFTGDSQGNYAFFAVPGNYTVQVAKSGYSTYSYPATIGGSGTALLPTSFGMVEAGDSICANVPVNRWSDQLANMSQFSGRVTANHNTCVSGRTIADIQAGYATEVYPYRPAVTGLPTYLFVAVGTNSLSDGGIGPAAAYTAIQSYWSTAKADGFTVLAFTVLNRGSSSGGTYYGNNIELYNDSLRAAIGTGRFDYLVDENVVLQNPYNPTFFNSADFTHPTQAGQQRIAQYINGMFGGVKLPQDYMNHKPAYGSYACDTSSLWQSTGTFNVGCGYQTLTSNTTGVNNLAVAPFALKANTTGSSNIAIGYQALTASQTASNNVAIGPLALTADTTGTGNIGIGNAALTTNTTGSNNVVLGVNAAKFGSTASNVTAIGTSALLNNTASNNTAIGLQALTANTSGDHNIALGVQALTANQTGVRSLAIGDQTLVNATAGPNTALGYSDLNALTTGTGNIAIGSSTATKVTTGVDNTVVGRQAGDTATIANANVTGSQNTWLGALSGPATTTQISNSTTVGYQTLATNSNEISLGNGSVTQMCFAGESVCWFKGAGVPAAGLCVAGNVGSLYSNTSGGAATTLYVCTAAATWTAN